jgi:hypothetical protein
MIHTMFASTVGGLVAGFPQTRKSPAGLKEIHWHASASAGAAGGNGAAKG